MKKTIAILSCLCFCVATNAASQQSISKISIGHSSADNPQGFVPFAGMGLGYMADSDWQTEGNPAQVKLLGSYYMDSNPWVIDAGIGALTQSFRSYRNTSSNINSLSLEAAGRLRLQNRWQMGPIWTVFTRQGERYGSSDDGIHFIGAQAIKEITVWDTNILRLGGRLMTDLNALTEAVNYIMLDAAIGFGGDAKRSSPIAESLKIEGIKMVPADEPVTVVVPQTPRVNFDVDQATLDRQAQDYVKRVSEALARHPGLVQKIEVVGHADQTGSAQHNVILSKKRAVNTAKLLPKKLPVKTAWKGESQPLINELNPQALQQNRRVELKIYSRNNEAVQRVLKSID